MDGLVLRRRQPLARSEQVRVQPVQVRVTPLLVHIEVTLLRMKRDPPVPAPLTVDPQRDLLTIVPDGIHTAASLPSSSATRASSRSASARSP